MIINDISTRIETFFPLSYACNWDNVGLIIGDRSANVTKVLLALDFDMGVAKEAKDIGAELIVTHHPIMFDPINKINSDTPVGQALLFLIENKIALYSAHTNMDCADGGTNDYLVNLYGFKNARHYDIEEGKPHGLSRISDLASPMTLKELASHIAKSLSIDTINYIGSDSSIIKTAFTCSGSGGSLITPDKHGLADVFITGDLKYSAARNFHEQGLNVIITGHYETEIFATDIFAKLLEDLDVTTVKSKTNTNIVKSQEL